MGSAVARALLRDGHAVTVWNRTAAKAETLVRDGAVVAPSAAFAVSASPTVVVCVDDYEVTNRILETKVVGPALAGRVLVQLSTGSPQEAREAEVWAWGHGADYLCGAILAYPDQIGTPDATILVSGAESAFRRSEPILKSLAGNLNYLGEQVGSAAALDCAVISFLDGAILGLVQGALICESEGLRVDSFGSMLAELAPVVAGEAKHLAEVIQTGAHAEPQATLKTYAVGVNRILRQARDARINAEIPTFTSDLLQRAIAAGYGEEEVASLIKVLRGGV
jgi:3-hydroxyisobutyrate dehydrogenase-like beta-hydroxyacid dehydrogenase